MAKYLVQGSYTSEGAKGLIAEGGTSRRQLITSLIEGMGGKVESFNYSFGEYDVHVIAEGGSHVDVAALSLAVAASGAVRLKTTVLLTPEEMDEAAKKSVAYRPPGA
jgi:uncharacterized protein with GYD domain